MTLSCVCDQILAYGCGRVSPAIWLRPPGMQFACGRLRPAPAFGAAGLAIPLFYVAGIIVSNSGDCTRTISSFSGPQVRSSRQKPQSAAATTARAQVPQRNIAIGMPGRRHSGKPSIMKKTDWHGLRHTEGGQLLH